MKKDRVLEYIEGKKSFTYSEIRDTLKMNRNTLRTCLFRFCCEDVLQKPRDRAGRYYNIKEINRIRDIYLPGFLFSDKPVHRNNIRGTYCESTKL